MAKELKMIPIKKTLELSVNEVRDILLRYFNSHSSRKFNFAYWNIIDPKHGKLLFVNLVGRDLVKVNNGDLRFRIVNISNKRHWEVIKWFVNKFLIDINTDKRAVNVIRLDYLFAYLKSIKYDPEQIMFGSNGFGSILISDEKSSKVISYVDRDIQSVYLIESLYNAFNEYEHVVGMEAITDIDSDGTEISEEDKYTYYSNDGASFQLTDRKEAFLSSRGWLITQNIKDAYVANKDFSVKIPDSNITVAQIDGLDCPSSTFLKKNPETSLTAVFVKDELSTKIISVLKTEGTDAMTVTTIRVYLAYYLGKRTKKMKCKAKGVEVL